MLWYYYSQWIVCALALSAFSYHQTSKQQAGMNQAKALLFEATDYSLFSFIFWCPIQLILVTGSLFCLGCIKFIDCFFLHTALTLKIRAMNWFTPNFSIKIYTKIYQHCLPHQVNIRGPMWGSIHFPLQPHLAWNRADKSLCRYAGRKIDVTERFKGKWCQTL